MPPTLALFLGVSFVVFTFFFDRKKRGPQPMALLWPTLWYIVAASRPFGYWMLQWGIPLPGGGGGDASEGSVIDRYFYATLMVIGLRVLMKRKFDWGATLRNNRWLTLLFAFMALSIVWSQYPFVSFKRFIKVSGSVVMALVILTDERPFDAFLTVLRRALYIHLPMSIICIKYYREIGVGYDWTGSMLMWQGISTSKNTLGQVCAIGVLYFAWEVKRRWSTFGWRNLDLVYLIMALVLLKGPGSSVSMTSLSACIVATVVFFRIQALRDRPYAIPGFVRKVTVALFSLVTLVMVHSVVMFADDSLFGTLITKFGRNITLTDRTFIWSDAYDAVGDSVLTGVGYGGFWIGREANIPWNSTMTWVLAQAHSGYVDTYLQVGAIGLGLLAMVLLTTPKRLLALLDDNFDAAALRLALFVTIVFVNITETTYLRGDHHLWLIMQTVLWIVPGREPLAETGSDSAPGESVPVEPVATNDEEPRHPTRL